MWMLYVGIVLLVLLLIIICIPPILHGIVEIKDAWELFKFRMRGDR